AGAAGLRVSDGVVVDDEQRTSDQSIFAVGDVATRLDGEKKTPIRIESWANAIESARIAASVIANEPPPSRQTPWFWTDQCGINIQIVGDIHGPKQVIQRGSDEHFCQLYFQDGSLKGAVSVDAGKDMSVLRRMLDRGLEITPEQAADESTALRDLLKRSPRRLRSG
ncbi:MAG: oxidoreductase C-terminal domain-containing protein, partial [Pseudomonadota bacterium]